MPVTKVKLTICGSSYIVSTTDSEEYVNQLAERLDNDMTEIMTQNPSASVAASAVDELNKNASSTDNMRAQIKDYLEDAAKAKLDAENARRQVEKLTAELEALKAKQATAAKAEAAEAEPAGEETPANEESNEQ